jgi:hypothetical protein
MESGINKNEKDLINEVFKNLNESSNKDLRSCLDILNNEYEKTKETIISLTKHMDVVESTYNKIFKVYQKRLNGK